MITKGSAIAERPARRSVSVEILACCCTNNADRSRVSLGSQQLLRSTFVPNLKSLSPPTTKTQRGTKCGKWGGLGQLGHRCHPRSLKLVLFDRAHTSSYLSLVTISLSCIVSEIQRCDILVENRRSEPTHLFSWLPLGVTPSNFAEIFGIRKLDPQCCQRNTRFSRLSSTPTCDRRTDGHTMTASTALAWRRAGKNHSCLHIKHCKTLELWYCPPLSNLPGEYSRIARSYLSDTSDHVVSAHERLSAAVWWRVH